MSTEPDIVEHDAAIGMHNDSVPSPGSETFHRDSSHGNIAPAPVLADSNARPPVQWLGMTFPPPLSNLVRTLGDFGTRVRKKTVTNLPNTVVNNSSNAIAMIQLSGEAMMLKANGTNFVPEQYRGWSHWWRYIVEPPKSVFNSVKGAKSDFKLADLAKPGYLKMAAKSFVDLDTATKLDSAGGKLLINRWQARSTFAGLVGMAFAAMLPDAKETPEDLEKRTALRHNHPLGYMGQTLGEALWFPVGTVIELGSKAVTFGHAQSNQELGKYKRQFTGLCLTIAGVCSFLSGFRNVGQRDIAVGKNVASNLKYVFNKAHSIGGAITGLAGSFLLFSISSDQGWERFGGIQWFRMLFLPNSIGSRFANHDPKAWFYVAGQGGMQAANTASFLIGGAEKLPDGTIVDHKAEREEAKRKVLEKTARGEYREETQEAMRGLAPEAKVSQVSEVQRAMPERHQAMAEVTA